MEWVLRDTMIHDMKIMELSKFVHCHGVILWRSLHLTQIGTVTIFCKGVTLI